MSQFTLQIILERKYYIYQETKPSFKLAPVIFPEFHCVTLSIVDILRENAFSDGCIHVQLFFCYRKAYAI